MLVAVLNGLRIEAELADRGLAYKCPNCTQSVILKRGRIKVAHFAHKPPTNCIWASNETLAHLESKKIFRDAAILRGLRSEVEFTVPSLPDDRRADVMIWSPSRVQVAIELQHSNIDLKEIERRSFSYARAGIAQAWVPFLNSKSMAAAIETDEGADGDKLIARYSARPFERWCHALHRGHLWFYEPRKKVLWRGHFDRHEIWVEESNWYSPEGEEMSAGGFYRVSKRWKELTLWGPYSVDQIRIKLESRKAWQSNRYNLPAGRIAKFVTDDQFDV